MFENVLVGVDGAAGGRDAIALASLLTGADGAITLVHVRPGAPRLRGDAPELVEDERQAAERLLADAREAAGVASTVADVVAKSPGAGLHSQAEVQAADLIVVGSSSRGVIGRAMLGDDTREALNGAPCAIAIAARAVAETHTALRRIGVAYDESPESKAALAVARELAAASHPQLRAMEVVSYPTSAYVGLVPGVFVQATQEAMAEARERLAALDGVEGEVAEGLAGEELSRFGDELDLLVCGSRGYGPVRRLVVGSTSNYLERHARCSLLVTPRV
jgi:nucleotide-binding universal stress UspA family protein